MHELTRNQLEKICQVEEGSSKDKNLIQPTLI